MSNQFFLGAIIGPMFLVMGLSLLGYSAAWQKAVSEWEKNHFNLMGVMLFNLIFGLTVINMHNVWEWSPYLLITLTGWIALFKSVVYFLVPGAYYKALIHKVNCKCYFQGSGAAMTALGLWLTYLVYMA